MEVVGLIPCAGRGSRLGLPFSKEMFPDVYQGAYRPVIMYTVEAMRQAGIEHLIFTINPGKTDLLRYLGNGRQFGASFSYVIHPEPRSLPESLDEAYHLVQGKTVAFAMPDTVITPQSFMADLLADHQSRPDALLTMGCFPASNPSKVGMVEIADGRATRLVDKPPVTDLTWMWGAMVWSPEFVESLRSFVQQPAVSGASREVVLSDALEPHLGSGRIYTTCFANGRYRDLGTYDEIVDWAKAVPVQP